VSDSFNEQLNQISTWFDEQFAALENVHELRERRKMLSLELTNIGKLLADISNHDAEKLYELIVKKKQIGEPLSDGKQELVEIEEAINKLASLVEYSKSRLNEYKPNVRTTRQSVPRGPISGKWTLRVTMPDGEVIQNPKAAETFVQVLAKFGLDRLAENKKFMQKGHPLVSRSRNPKGQSVYEYAGYYIDTHSGTEYKAELLERIANYLGRQIKVEAFKN
jgi:hypothetical protein